MAYSLDLRQKVIDYLKNGGRITKAAKVFAIGRASIYRWLDRKDSEATKVEHRQRQLDWKALENEIPENPEARLKERAKKFGVSSTAIFSALTKTKITRKKKELRYRQRNRQERIKYYNPLSALQNVLFMNFRVSEILAIANPPILSVVQSIYFMLSGALIYYLIYY